MLSSGTSLVLMAKRKQGKMQNTIRNLAVVSVLSLALTGCVAQYEMANPIDDCNGFSVDFTTTTNRPVAYFVQDTSTTGRDTRFTLQVTRESDAVSFDSLRIEYRLGFYNSIGFNEEVLSAFDLSGTTSRDSFLDLMAFADPMTLSIDVSRFGQVPGDADSIEISGTFLDLTLGTAAREFFSDVSGTVERLGLLVYPGAFLLSCSEEEAASNEYASAIQMFPNLEALDQTPVFDAESQTLFIETPEHLIGLDAQGIAIPLPTAEVSRDVATTAWLQLIASQGDPTAAIFSGTVERSETAERVIGVSSLESLGGDNLPEGSYILFFVLASPGIVSEEGESNISSDFVFRTATYLVEVAANGNSTVEYLTELDYPRVPSTTGRNQPTLDLPDKIWRVSTKGFRNLALQGTNLGNVNKILIAEKPAKVVASSYSQMELALPKMKAGQYPLTFVQGSTLVTAKQKVRYYKSKKVFETRITSAQGTPTWSKLIARQLGKTDATQVNCLARIPQGSTSAKISKLATSVCDVVSRLNKDVKVRTITVESPRGSSGDVLVRFWN